MSQLYLDVLGNKGLVDGYQIEDSIAQKYNLKPGSICPFTRLHVEILSSQQVREVEETERQKKIKQQKKALGKENLSTVDSKISGYVAGVKTTTKSINRPSESHDFAHERARTVCGPVRRNRIFEKEEVLMATAKKVPAKPAKAPAKTKPPVKAPAKAAAKPAQAKAKAVAKAPAKAKVKATVKAVAKKTIAKKPAKAKK